MIYNASQLETIQTSNVTKIQKETGILHSKKRERLWLNLLEKWSTRKLDVKGDMMTDTFHLYEVPMIYKIYLQC